MNYEFWPLSTSWHRHWPHAAALLPPGALVPPGLRNRVSIQSPTLLSARLFFQRTGQPPALLTFLFFSSPRRQQIKRSPHTINSTYWYSFHRKEVNKFLMSYAGNKSSVSSNQSWVSRVHSCFNPSTPASSRRSRVWAQRPPRAADLVWHVGSGATSWLTQSCWLG